MDITSTFTETYIKPLKITKNYIEYEYYDIYHDEYGISRKPITASF